MPGPVLSRYVPEVSPLVEMDRERLRDRIAPVVRHHLTATPPGAVPHGVPVRLGAASPAPAAITSG